MKRPTTEWIVGVGAFLTLLVLSFCTSARADGNKEVWLEGGSTYLRAPAVVAKIAVEWKHIGIGDIGAECSTTFIGPSFNQYGSDYVRQTFAFGCMLLDGIGPVDFGIGHVYRVNTDSLNGSQFNYALMIRVRPPQRWEWAKNLRFTLDQHWSNGGSVEPNTGRDMALLGVRLAF